MSWQPNDLIADADLFAYESALAGQFGTDDWDDKRAKAIEDWLWPILRANHLPVENFRTRYQPDQVWGYTGGSYSDLTSGATNDTADDLDLAGILATPGSDALYIGSVKPFRGLSWRVLDAVSAVSGTVTVAYWADSWVSLSLSNQTNTTGLPFMRGGAMTWRTPSDWTRRPISTSDALYWAKVTVSAVPTSAKAGQLGVIRRSVLCAPATFRALALIMREAPTGADGPWREKALWYEEQANQALERALQTVGGEFDTDDSDQIDADEEDQTTAEAGGGPFRLERG